MVRSSWKPKFFDKNILKYLLISDSKNFLKKKIRIYSRRSYISNFFINTVVGVYTGKKFFFFRVEKNILRLGNGFKFGEFSFSKHRGRKIHAKKEQVVKKSNKVLKLKKSN